MPHSRTTRPLVPDAGSARMSSRPTARWRLVAGLMALLTFVGVTVGACGTSGRELRDPAPGATAPPRKNPSSTTAVTSTALGLSIVSPAWAPGETVPKTFTCDGSGVSPPLTLGSASEGTAELVVIVTDPDAGGRVHWVLAGLDPNGATITEGAVPDGAVVGRSTAGPAAWEPLCPPSGQTHTYEFAVYALPAPSGITENTPAAEAQTSVVNDATNSAVLTGTYGRRA